MAKKEPKALQRMRQAANVMGINLFSHDQFVYAAMRWFADRFGDFHAEYHEDVGWSVACCYEDETWNGWIHGKKLADALAKAVLKVSVKSTS